MRTVNGLSASAVVFDSVGGHATPDRIARFGTVSRLGSMLVALVGWLCMGVASAECIDYGDYLHWVGGADTPGDANRVAVSGNHAYVADRESGLQVIDVTNPASPQIVGSVSMPGSAWGVAVSGSYASSREIRFTVELPQAAAPKATVSGTSVSGYVAAGSTVKLTADSGATIYYTTDGSAPTSASSVYSGPITLTKDVTIRAIAAASGKRSSNVTTVSYKVGTFYTIAASAGTGGSVSPSGSTSVLGGADASFSITPSSGYRVDDVTVDGKSVGAVTSYTFPSVSAGHTGKASFASTAALPFTDVPQNAWYYQAVSNACAQNLFAGTSSTAFSPDTAMSRGMFVTVLGRCAGYGSLGEKAGLVTATGVNIRKGPSTDTAVAGFISGKNTAVQVTGSSGDWYQIRYGSVTGYIRSDLMKAYNGQFSDLAGGLYYTPFAQWAALAGIAGGTSFSANASITREDMCLMLYRYAAASGKTLPATVQKQNFSDDASISASARTAVYALQQAGVISGMGNGTFAPKGSATRAQVAQIFLNFTDALK